MLNFNKSFRDSNSKSRSRTIYAGNKSHTASMNLKVSQDLCQEFTQLPLKDIINKNQERLKITFRQDQKNKSMKKLKYNPIKLHQNPNLFKKNIHEKVRPYKENVRVLETQRFMRQRSNFKKNIEHNAVRLKTDMNEQKHEKYEKYDKYERNEKHFEKNKRIKDNQYIQITIEDLTEFIKQIQSLKKTKQNLNRQLNFYKNHLKKNNLKNSIMQALCN